VNHAENFDLPPCSIKVIDVLGGKSDVKNIGDIEVPNIFVKKAFLEFPPK